MNTMIIIRNQRKNQESHSIKGCDVEIPAECIDRDIADKIDIHDDSSHEPSALLIQRHGMHDENYFDENTKPREE